MATRIYDCWLCCQAECPDGFGKSIFGVSGLCPDATTAASPVILQLKITLDKATAINPSGFDLDCLPDEIYLKFRSYTRAIGKTCEQVYCNNYYKICYGSEFGDHEGFPTLRFNRNLFLKITDSTQDLYTVVPFTDSFGQFPEDPECVPVIGDNFDGYWPSDKLTGVIDCDSITYPITLSSDILGYAYPYTAYSCSPFIINYNGYMNVGSGLTVWTNLEVTKVDDCSTPYESVDPYWCTPEGCVRSATEPVGATGGPYSTRNGCLELCETSVSYWCLYGQCVESATEPHIDATGPYASPSECSAACAGPAEMVYVCTPAGCGTTSKAYAVINSISYYADLSTCESNCDSEFYCTAYGCIEWWDAGSTPVDATSGPYSDLSSCQSSCGDYEGAGYYCVDGSCEYYTSRPVGAYGPKYATDGACEADCGGAAGWYCVDFVCGYYASAPGGATSGPHASEALCLDNCVVEAVSPFPISETDNKPPQVKVKQVKQLPPKVSLEIIKNPCRHLGSDLDASSCLPCGTPKRYECAIHGICTKLRRVKDSKMSCVECYEKKLGYEPSL